VKRAAIRRPTGLEAQRILWTNGMVVAPALTALAIVWSHTTEHGAALLTGLAVLAVGLLVERERYPDHLLPLSGLLLRFVAPLLGIALAGAAWLAMGGFDAGALLIALLGCWIVIALILVTIARLRAQIQLRLAVIGSPELTASLAAELRQVNLPGYRVLGWIDAHNAWAPKKSGLPCLGDISEAGDLVDGYGIDLLVYGVRESGMSANGLGPESSIDMLGNLSQQIVGRPVRLMGANQLYEELFGHVPLATINAAWFRYVLHPNYHPSSPRSKRIFDFLCALAMAPLALPLIALSAIAIKLDDRGPVFYRQERLGEGGRPFQIVKLRTMGVDAERAGPQWSSLNDSRVTKVGRFLRSSHLDELPQLWNVIRGELSLVGPRPERPEFVAELERELNYYDRRLLMKPGVTGWAQVRIGYAGSESGTAWKLAHDLYYLKHRSNALDLMIMLETVATPIRDRRMALRLPDETFVLAATGQRE
jgi:exopolysaccharide biosynthesis polyprenyl glycosylphosphotransferase